MVTDLDYLEACLPCIKLEHLKVRKQLVVTTEDFQLHKHFQKYNRRKRFLFSQRLVCEYSHLTAAIFFQTVSLSGI